MTEREQFEILKQQLKGNPVATPELLEFLWTLQMGELPNDYEKNKWYRYTPESKICSDGTPYHGCLRIGTENKLMIMFCGGGVSVDDYTAARPSQLSTEPGTVDFYSGNVFLMGDVAGRSGIASDKEPNPFKNWSVLFVPYASGDFHCGTNDYRYNDKEKGEGILYHHGYTNYRALIEKMKELVPAPEKLLVTGFSAGGFGTALLTDDVMDVYENCNDVTCFPDGCILYYQNWREVAKKIWCAPKSIYERLTSEDITVDSLIALRKKRGDRVKIIFACSYRDALIGNMQLYFDGKERAYTRTCGDRVTEMLRLSVARMQNEIPNIGLYIYDAPHPESGDAGLTQHCFNANGSVFTLQQDGVKALDWLLSAMEGKTMQVGLHLLGL